MKGLTMNMIVNIIIIFAVAVIITIIFIAISNVIQPPI